MRVGENSSVELQSLMLAAVSVPNLELVVTFPVKENLSSLTVCL
jgi:hypothetical protein